MKSLENIIIALCGIALLLGACTPNGVAKATLTERRSQHALQVRSWILILPNW